MELAAQRKQAGASRVFGSSRKLTKKLSRLGSRFNVVARKGESDGGELSPASATMTIRANPIMASLATGLMS